MLSLYTSAFCCGWNVDISGPQNVCPDVPGTVEYTATVNGAFNCLCWTVEGGTVSNTTPPFGDACNFADIFPCTSLGGVLINGVTTGGGTSVARINWNSNPGPKRVTARVVAVGGGILATDVLNVTVPGPTIEGLPQPPVICLNQQPGVALSASPGSTNHQWSVTTNASPPPTIIDFGSSIEILSLVPNASYNIFLTANYCGLTQSQMTFFTTQQFCQDFTGSDPPNTGKDLNNNSGVDQKLSINRSPFGNKANVFPNPVKNGQSVTIQLPTNTDQTVNIDVTDLTGKMIKRYQSIDSGQSLDISELSGGVYFLSLQGEQYHDVIKLMVQD